MCICMAIGIGVMVLIITVWCLRRHKKQTILRKRKEHQQTDPVLVGLASLAVRIWRHVCVEDMSLYADRLRDLQIYTHSNRVSSIPRDSRMCVAGGLRHLIRINNTEKD